MTEKKRPAEKKASLPAVMAVIPAVLAVLEIIGLILTSNAGELGLRRSPALFLMETASVAGIFATPFFCLVFEIIGLVSAVRRRKKAFIIILTAELVLTVLAAICGVIFLLLAMKA